MVKNDLPLIFDELKALAKKTLSDCTFTKQVQFLGMDTETTLLLPSGDEKYNSFWTRDAVMMTESGFVPNDELKKYVEIFATHAQSGSEARPLENRLEIPPYAIADHLNYDGGAVFFPGTCSSGVNQGDGRCGFFPPFCDNYYFILLVGYYADQSGDTDVLKSKYGTLTLLERLKYAFDGYNIDPETELCVSEADRYTVDWGFVDTIKKSGKLLMASLLRYNAALTLSRLCEEGSDYYTKKADKIKQSVLDTFFDEETGWFYSATGIGHQFDVWATAYAVYSGITENEKTLKALYSAYKDKTAVINGYVRHILSDKDFSPTSAWEDTWTPMGEYQNGAYWATPTGWYAYALYKYNGETEILSDFLAHTKKYADKGAPFEWTDAKTENVSGLNYGTSGVLPYIAAKKIIELK